MDLEEEVLDAAHDESGAGLVRLVDQFRARRDVRELFLLLDSVDPDVLATVVWVLSEVEFEKYDSGVVLARLRSLLEHGSAQVRFYALSAVFPDLDWADPSTQALLQRLREDPNKGVRMAAESAICRLAGVTRTKR